MFEQVYKHNFALFMEDFVANRKTGEVMRERLRVFVKGSDKETKLIEKRLNTMWARLERIHGLQIEKTVEPLSALLKQAAPAASKYYKKLANYVGYSTNFMGTAALDKLANDAFDLVKRGFQLAKQSRAGKFGSGAAEVLLKKGGKVIPLVGTGIGAGLAVNELSKGELRDCAGRGGRCIGDSDHRPGGGLRKPGCRTDLGREGRLRSRPGHRDVVVRARPQMTDAARPPTPHTSKERGDGEMSTGVSPERSADGTVERWGRVHGVVTTDLGPVDPGWVVHGFDLSLTDERSLGDCPIADGRYVLEYPRRDAGQRGTRANLQVRVFSDAGEDLERSVVRFNAGPVEEIDVTVWGPLSNASLFERAMAAVRAVLGDLELVELVEDEEHQEVSFLATASGVGLEVVTDLRDCHRLALEAAPTTGLSKRVVQASKPRSFRARATARRVLRVAENRCPGRPGVGIESPAAGRHFPTAVATGLIPQRPCDDLDQLEARIAARALDHQISRSDEGQPGRVGDLLSTLPQQLTPAKERGSRGSSRRPRR